MKINNMIIPTFGYHWYLVDYGLIIHPKFKFNKYEKYAQETYLDIFALINLSVAMPIWNIIMKNNIKIEKYEKLVNKIINTPEINIIKKYLPNLNTSHHKKIINDCI